MSHQAHMKATMSEQYKESLDIYDLVKKQTDVFLMGVAYDSLAKALMSTWLWLSINQCIYVLTLRSNYNPSNRHKLMD